MQQKEKNSILWDKFIIWLQKKFSNLIIFVKIIVSNFKQDFQYQEKKFWDYVFYLEFFQSILLEFQLWRASSKLKLIDLFFKGLKLLVKAKLEQKRQKLDNFKEIIELAIQIKAKPSFSFSSTSKIWTSNLLKGYHLILPKISLKAFWPQILEIITPKLRSHNLAIILPEVWSLSKSSEKIKSKRYIGRDKVEEL